jgi:hypothetical protein
MPHNYSFEASRSLTALSLICHGPRRSHTANQARRPFARATSTADSHDAVARGGYADHQKGRVS